MLVKRCPNLSVLHLTGLAPRELGDYALTSVRYLSYDVSPGDSNYCLGLVPSSDEHLQEEALASGQEGFYRTWLSRLQTLEISNSLWPEYWWDEVSYLFSPVLLRQSHSSTYHRAGATPGPTAGKKTGIDEFQGR